MNLTVFDRVLTERDTLRTALADTLRERDALEQQRDEALLALSALCESCGGTEPHTLQACTAHLTKTLALLQQVREELLKTHPERP